MRNFSSWISLSLAGTMFFLTASAFALFAVLDAGNIKQALREENVYSAIVPTVLSQAAEDKLGGGQLPLSEPWVHEAAEKAFPPSDLEQKANTAIDSTFAWLEGKTAEPNFKLDFTENKQRFAMEVGNYAQNRLEELPPCTLSNLPESTDPLEVNCLPPGFSAVSLAETARQRVSTSDDFLADPVITPGNLNLSVPETEKAAGINALEPLEGTKPLFEHRQLILWGLSVAVIILALGGLLLATNRPKAMRHLAISLLLAAASLVLIAVVTAFVVKELAPLPASDVVSRDIANPILANLAGQAQQIYFIFAAIAVVTALVLFIAGRKTERSNASKPPGFQ